MQFVKADGFEHWRATARQLLARDIAPEAVAWDDSESAPTLFDSCTDEDRIALDRPIGRSITVPPEFLKIAKQVACHCDPRRWDVLYRVLWRLTHGERYLLELDSDTDMRELTLLQKAVSRDVHKMKAFVRFRRVDSDEAGERYIAWHRPDHRIVPLAAPFFARRFPKMNWSILTPDASVHWNRLNLEYGSGVSAEKGLPEEWGEKQNVRWKTPLPGRGHSSPVVWGKRVFVTTAVEGAIVPGAKAAVHKIEGQEWRHPDSLGADRRHAFKVIALDRDTGKVLWEQTAWEGTPYDDRHRKSSYAASTPATDGKMVYAYFGAEGLYAYDVGGKLAWKFMPGKLGTLGMGAATSPVLFGNVVIVQADEEEGKDSFIVGLDKKTGKEVWRSPRKVQASWATPLLINTGKRTELIASGTESVIAYDPATGKELWRSKGLESNAIPSPVATAGHDMVVVSAGYPAKVAYAIRLGASGEVKDADIAWRYAKGTAYVPSPILYGDYLYLLTDKGIMTCLDARTGEVKYEGARVPVPATFTASPVAFDGKILLTSEDGDTFVVRAGPRHEVLRTNSVGEPVYASPAVADGKLFIRGEKHLYAIEQAKK